MNTKEIGNIGEDKACEYLKSNGYIILQRNYHTRYGEIDIIASKGDTVIFCEVKTRKSSFFAQASEYVDFRKQKKIIITSRFYLGKTCTQSARYDVIEVYYRLDSIGNFETKSINHIENAFMAQ